MPSPTRLPGVFIGWSGSRSQQLARGLEGLIKEAIPRVRVFMSETRIDSGTAWQKEIAAGLRTAKFGVICITRENALSPWLYFEAGALSTSEVPVCPYYLDEPPPKDSPLAIFQSRKADYAETQRLIYDLNAVLDAEYRQEPRELDKKYKSAWKRLDVLASKPRGDKSIELLGAATDIMRYAGRLKHRDDLFTHLVSCSVRRVAKQATSWPNDQIAIEETEVLGKGIEVFGSLRTGGRATFLVPLNAFWSTGSDYMQRCRTAATRLGQNAITRIFLLQNEEPLFSKSLRSCVVEDQTAGIATHICFVWQVRPEAARDFGIWDGELLCRIDANGDRPTGCTFSRREEELGQAEEWWDEILRKSRPSDEVFAEVDKNLLLRTAPKMAERAGEMCTSGYMAHAQEGCDWYHRGWQYLRILGLVSTPDWHADFYLNELTMAFLADKRRVLICSAADYAMLDHVMRAIPKELREDVKITMLDLCPTPVEMCQIYQQIKTDRDPAPSITYQVPVDILNNNLASGCYDVIVTDAFLTRFRPEQQPEVTAEWSRLLAPGGLAITTIRVARDGRSEIRTSAEDVKRFSARARQQIQNFPCLGPKLGAIVGYAREYAERMVSYPVPRDCIGTIFGDRYECRIAAAATPGEFERETEYARVVATRRLKPA